MYKKLNSDLWGTLYSSSKRCRVVRRLYYLFASVPVVFPRSSFYMKPSFGIRVKIRRVAASSKRRPDYFKVLCNLKFRSHGGLLKPGKGSKFKKKQFVLSRLKTFYGNYSWPRWFRFLKKVFGKGNPLGRGELHFFSYFERRISTILFRSGFFINIYDAKEAVRLGYVLINGIGIRAPNALVNNWDFISFIPFFFFRLKKFIIFRLRFFRFLYGPPLYLEVDFNYCHMVFIRKFFLFKNIKTTFLTRSSILQGLYNNSLKI